MDPTEPKPTAPDVFDILPLIHNEVLRSLVKRANDELAENQFDIDTLDEVATVFTAEIDELIGGKHLGETAIVTGNAHYRTADRTLATDTIALHDEELCFYGAVVEVLDGTPQVFLSFYTESDLLDDDDEPITNDYYLLIDNIKKADIYVSETLLDLIQHSAEDAKAQTSSPDFLSLPAIDQRIILDQIATDFDLNLYEGDTDGRVVIYHVDAEYFMGMHTDLPISLEDSIFRPDAVKAENNGQTILAKGVHEGTIYAELIDNPSKHFIQPADFNLGAGAPCILLKNIGDKATYVVPVAAIRDIVVTDDPSMHD